MLGDRTFKIAFTFSLILHAALFLQLPQIKALLPIPKLKPTEVNYIKDKIPLPILEAYKRQLSEKQSHNITSKSVAPAPNVSRIGKENIFKKSQSIPVKKPDLAKLNIIAVKKDVSLPTLIDEKMSNPVYLNYYQIVREEIRHAAYQNYTRSVNGEVYLSFILFRNGDLKQIKVNQSKSLNRYYLRETAIQSIKDASPFPHFPEDLDYPELSFNVIISFEAD